jgi:hypothetical protein
MVFTALLGNFFQQWMLLCCQDLHPCRLAAISHQPPTLLTAVSGLSHKITLRLTVSHQVLAYAAHDQIQYLLLFDSYGLVFVGRPL